MKGRVGRKVIRNARMLCHSGRWSTQLVRGTGQCLACVEAGWAVGVKL